MKDIINQEEKEKSDLIMKYENNINELTHKFLLIENRNLFILNLNLETNQFNPQAITSNNNFANISHISKENLNIQTNLKPKSKNKSTKTNNITDQSTASSSSKANRSKSKEKTKNVLANSNKIYSNASTKKLQISNSSNVFKNNLNNSVSNSLNNNLQRKTNGSK